MSTLGIIENKISSVRKYLMLLEGFKKYPQAELFHDTTISGAFERYLYLVTQATIELGESYIAYQDFRKPTTMRETFAILRENGIIGEALEKKLSDMAGFRNALAHDYEELDLLTLYEALHNRLGDIEEFISIVGKSIKNRQ